MGLRRVLLALACAACTVALGGCFLEPEEEEGAALREGLSVRVGGVEYTVYMTRQLNPELSDDRGYWQGPEAEPGFALFGIFIQACNRSGDDDALEERSYTSTEDFTVVDTQGNEYEPLEPDEDNVFHYHAGSLAPRECTPRSGSLAHMGPTGGAMLPFEFPLETIENRPLELEIRDGGDEVAVELDL